MSEDIYSMTRAGFHEALRQAKEQAWNEGADAGYQLAVQEGPYSDYQAEENPYRIQS